MKNIENTHRLIRNFSDLRLDSKITLHPYSSIFKSPEKYLNIINGKYWQQITPSPENHYKKQKTDESDSISPAWEAKTTGETIEEGEVTDQELQESEDIYELFEYPGIYWSDKYAYTHMGYTIRTVTPKNHD